MEQNTTLCAQCTCVDCVYRRENPPWRGRVVYWGLVALLCAAIAYTLFTSDEIPGDPVEKRAWKLACEEIVTLPCIKFHLGFANAVVAFLKLTLLMTIGCHACCSHILYLGLLTLDLATFLYVMWRVRPSLWTAVSPWDVLAAVPVLVPSLVLWAGAMYVEWIVTYRVYVAPKVDNNNNKKET